ncbi:DUF3574 domain-containing protein [Silanimonas algicola]
MTPTHFAAVATSATVQASVVVSTPRRPMRPIPVESARTALRPALLAIVLFALAGCAGVATNATPTDRRSPTLQGDAARPRVAAAWRRSELYFGVGDRDDPATRIDDARWQGFLDREVTPRFPDGLTVLDAYGQWLFRGQAAPERLDSKVLVILHPDTAEERAKIDAIRSAWKAETGHQSVLWASQAADVSF